MFVKDSINGVLAEVDDALGEKLLASGTWVSVDEAAAERKPRAKKVVDPAAEGA